MHKKLAWLVLVSQAKEELELIKKREEKVRLYFHKHLQLFYNKKITYFYVIFFFVDKKDNGSKGINEARGRREKYWRV